MQGVISGLSRDYFTVVIIPLNSAGGYLNPDIVKSADEVVFVTTQREAEMV